MLHQDHTTLVNFIWGLANKLRGPYRPPQYRKVMLPLVVLRRLDLVLELTKEAVLETHARLVAQGFRDVALEKRLSRVALGAERTQQLYNTSSYTFQKLMDDAPNIATNLVTYINGFSPRARDIFEKFEFEAEIQKLDESKLLPRLLIFPQAIDHLLYILARLARAAGHKTL